MNAIQILKLVSAILPELNRIIEQLKSREGKDLTEGQKERLLGQLDKFQIKVQERFDRIREKIDKE